MMQLKDKRKITVIIPCRNEEKYIEKCINSVIEQDYPLEKLEILVVDGMSEDGTREILRSYIKNYAFIRIFDNPRKFTPFAFNIGIKNATGQIILIIGAHACFEKDYIAKCISAMDEYRADNAGGIWRVVPSAEGVIADSIAFSLVSPFGSGDAYYKISHNKPRFVDTVFGGCYKREVFERIGNFNENLIRSQDWELNLRLKKNGGKIILVPDARIVYYPKSTLKEFFVHNFKDGFWIVYPLKFVNIPFNIRHYIPLIFFVLLMILASYGVILDNYFPLFLFLFIYFSLAFVFSFKIFFEKSRVIYLLFVPLVFFIRHAGFGLGTFWGMVKLFTDKFIK